ncbi:MAG: ABC transporter permease subunit [Alphaproteobacteria bacterium]|nr:ABC transporter permease subunit [Alphaproteobacteria bacterium]
MRRDPAGSLGALLVLLLLGFAMLGPLVAQHPPDAIALARRLQPPSALNWLGTDELGRDVFARLAHGAWPSLMAALLVVGTTVTLGTLLGAFSALLGGLADAVAMRIIDVLLAVPALVLAMALAAALGPSLVNALIALVVVRLPVFVRLARAQALVLRSRPFAEFARLAGAGRWHVLRHHLLPNLAGIMVVQGLMDVAAVILGAAALGFIGLGAQPPSPEWGGLVASGRHFMADAWWLSLFPGLALMLAALGFNLLGDLVRDVLDPRQEPAP